MASAAAISSEQKWQQLYDSKRNSVRGKVRRILRFSLGRNTNCEDVCQDAWTRLWRLGERYWNPRGVNFCARNAAIDWLRKDKTHEAGQHLSLRELSNEPFPEDENDEAPPRNLRNGVRYSKRETEIINVLAIPEITAKIRFLPPEQQAVFSFRYGINGHEELTFPEIAERLGIEQGVTISIFCQAKRNLRMILGEEKENG